ncbi:MAG: hypothetical protein GF383_12935 [Candidatus Lokiarchaeota archaeon]|nr:hypothetical protein [Candidatus Lokiarchaeota archaeon]MBD3341991.1 hypothetical protein [Candidatus Lokiarchaeota archaeon]
MVRSTLKKRICFVIFGIFLMSILGPNLIFYIIPGSNPYGIISEGVAAEDPEVDFSDLPSIDYDYLNDLWYNPKIEMLVIVPPGLPGFKSAVEPLVEWKNQKGVKTIILDNYTAYPGADNPERIRNMIKSYYEKENIRWVLLCGDAQNDLIPIRYVYNPDVLRYGQGKTEDIPGEYDKPTDFYYADLTGNWDEDGDGNYGENANDNSNGVDEIDWTPEVYVGRLPAGDAAELEVMINKTLKYETNPDVGQWMNQMLLAGGISDLISEEPPDGEDESRLTEYITQHYTKQETNYTHLVNFVSYEPSQPYTSLTPTSFENNFNDGYSTVIFAGHGSPTLFTDKEDTYYTSSKANNPLNYDKPSLIYADACSTSAYDATDDNIGELLIKSQDAGAIGYIGGLRTTWYYTDDTNLEKLNRGNAKLFWKEFFVNKKFQQGRALYDSKVAYMQSDYYIEGDGSINYDFERKQILTYCLLGDPEVDIYTNVPKNASNPFVDPIYAGQLYTTVIMDNNSDPVPYARVYLTSSNGLSRTVYADKNGRLSMRVHSNPNLTYNATITGHNLILSTFNFTTNSDSLNPVFLDESCDPKDPSVSDEICFKVDVQDSESGLEKVFLLKGEKEDDFEEFDYYTMFNSFKDEEGEYKAFIDKLDPGTHYFLIVARDWANNYEILEDSDFEIAIEDPITTYALIIGSIIIIGAVASSIFVMLKGNRKYHEIIERLS